MDETNDRGAAAALDISNKPSPHGLKNKLGRLTWGVVQGTLFRYSPRPFKKWRVFLLRCFGANVSWKARIMPSATIWAPWNLEMDDYATLGDGVICYCVDRTRIGRQSTISQYSYLCGATHGFEDPNFPLTPMPITIGADCWVAADVFVAPGVTIGDGTVVGARSSVFGDLPPGKVCIGSPAKPVRDRVIAGATD